MFVSTLGLCANAGAQTFRGQPDDFLLSGVGARALSMGGAFTALADDVTALVYNPAGLGLLQANEVQLMHAPLFYSTDLEFAGMAFPLTPAFTLGAGAVLLKTSGIEERDQFNQILGSGETASQSAYLFSFATRAGRFHLGGTAKVLNQALLGHTGSAIGADLGALYPLADWVRAGLALQNINRPNIQLISAPDVFQMHATVGAAFFIPGNRLTVTTEYRIVQGSTADLVAGGEMRVTDGFFVRAGVDRQAQANFGFGIRYAPLQFDYAYGQNSLGGLNRFSLSYRFGQLFRVRVSPEYEGGEAAAVLGPNTNQITFRVDAAHYPVEWWKMLIRGPDGALLRQIDGTGTPPVQFWWDLRDSLGRPIHEGEYPFEFQVKYRGGTVWSEKGVIKTLNPFAEGPAEMRIKLPELP